MADNVTYQGPVFGSTPEMMGLVLATRLMDRIAAFAIEDVHKRLDDDIRYPTPFYETQVRISNSSTSRMIHDNGVIYGPWLEGVSHMNALTPFKGYHSFRNACQHTIESLGPIISSEVQHYVDSLGG